MTAIIIILIVLLLASSLYLAFKYGYEKGVGDLTEEIDKGIRQIKKEKFEKQIEKASESWKDVDVDDFMAKIRGYDLREQNDSD